MPIYCAIIPLSQAEARLATVSSIMFIDIIRVQPRSSTGEIQDNGDNIARNTSDNVIVERNSGTKR